MVKVLVTGGAGYIGSHIVKILGEKGYDILIYDNLSKGHKEAILYGKLIIGDLKDKSLLSKVLSSYKPDIVIHMAAFIEAGLSVKDPVLFYKNNRSNTINLISTMLEHNIRKFIFSSTAAIFGNPEYIPIDEDHPIKPINPYGYSKAFIEDILYDLSFKNDFFGERVENFNYVSLRYFNAAGADPSGKIGESHNPETHLIPLVLKTAKGERAYITIYGTDYPTEDGTAIRDYIHVNDLGQLHVLAMEYLLDGGKSNYFNCGYGRGYSVKEIIDISKKVTGKDFPIKLGERREGDPSILIADNKKIKRELSWEPSYDDITLIIQTAWNWELKRRY